MPGFGLGSTRFCYAGIKLWLKIDVIRKFIILRSLPTKISIKLTTMLALGLIYSKILHWITIV